MVHSLAKEDEQKPKAQQHAEKKAAASIVRIAGRDINGELDIPSSLMQIKGIGYNLAHALSLSIKEAYNIDSSATLGSLSDQDIGNIETLLKDPKKTKIPIYMFNRRNDRDSGEDMHLVGTDLIVKVRQDIDNDIRIQSWRGFRHRWGQKVRGQKTRSTGRTGETVGVTKKAAEEAEKAAKAPSGGKAPAASAAPAAAPAAKAAAPAGEAKK